MKNMIPISAKQKTAVDTWPSMFSGPIPKGFTYPVILFEKIVPLSIIMYAI